MGPPNHYNYSNDIVALMSCDLLSQLANCPVVSLVKLNAALTMLINAGIPFDTEYSPGTRRDASGLQITVYITPVINVVYNLTFGEGASQFTAN